MSWTVWLVAAVLFAVVEMITTTLFVIPFSAGALAALVVAVADGPAVLQLVAFLAGSGGAFLVVRPIAARHRSQPPLTRTGTAALIGQGAVVLDEVSRHAGTVKLGGEIWTARPYDPERVLGPGAEVEVVEIRGATALVD